MKEIYQLNNLLNLSSEINRPLNKTHRIKVSSVGRRGAVLANTNPNLIFRSTVHLLRCVAELHCVRRDIRQHLSVPAAAVQISAIDSERFRSDFACGHLTAGALCRLQQSQGHNAGIRHRFGEQRTAVNIFDVLS